MTTVSTENQKQKNESFYIDQRILSNCVELGEWPLSQVLLKNNANFPWLILVPRLTNIQDIDQLSQDQRYLLMDEISALSTLTKTYFKPDKINIGTLGNIVSQLHIHVIARFVNDKLWPHGCWQAAQESPPYNTEAFISLVNNLRIMVNNAMTLT